MPTSGGLASMGRVLSAITDQTNEVSERTPSESMQLAGSVTYIHTCHLSLSLAYSVWLGRVGRDLWLEEALVNF